MPNKVRNRFAYLKFILVILIVVGVAVWVPNYVGGLGELLRQHRWAAFILFSLIGLNAIGLVRAATDSLHPELEGNHRRGYFIGTWLGVTINLLFEIGLYLGFVFKALHIASLFAIFLWILTCINLGKSLYQGGMAALTRELGHPFLPWVLGSIVPASLIAWKWVDIDTNYAQAWKKIWDRTWNGVQRRAKKFGIELRD